MVVPDGVVTASETVVGSVATPDTLKVFVSVASSDEDSKNTVAPTLTYPSETEDDEVRRAVTVAVDVRPAVTAAAEVRAAVTVGALSAL